MIEKMQFINITGPKQDIDRMVNVYLNKYDIHLENALTELKNVKDLRPFVEVNPYKDILNVATEMVKKIKRDTSNLTHDLTLEEASSIIRERSAELEQFSKKKNELKSKRNHIRELITQIEPFRQLDYDLRKILHFRFIKYRFGRISNEYYDKFISYVYENLNTVFYDCYKNKDYVWGVYFAPESTIDEVDAIYTSLHFERISLPDEYEGTPEQAYQSLNRVLEGILEEIRVVYDEINSYIDLHADELLAAYEKLSSHNHNFNIRKLSSIMQEKVNGTAFYILCGWMVQKDVNLFIEDIKDDANVFVLTDGIEEEGFTYNPPTKLNNPKIVRPFEMFIRMYGLPAYNEIDPTIFLAITYSILYGAMFGDVGQGLCLAIGGALLYQFKKINIGAVVGFAGIFSTIFGFAYGSVFGFEDVIEGFWMKPMNNVMTVLMISVAVGVCIILFSIVLNIINSVRTHDLEKLLFDPNGISGLIFYASGIGCVIAIFTGHTLPGTIALSILLGLPLLAIFFKEPLTRLAERETTLIHGSFIMFFIEALVEMFDVLLSYVTNSISFLRVGAFALSHAGMMSVVLTLAGVESGNTNWIIIVFGNILVAAMEGLIVGIQVLRLEYYEIFGRFYRGTGKEFKPFSEMK